MDETKKFNGDLVWLIGDSFDEALDNLVAGVDPKEIKFD